MVEIERDEESAPFFDAANEGELVIKRCEACGHFAGPATSVCPACHGRALAWAIASGRGSLVSWVVIHGREGATTAGIVELDEGPWLDARLVDVEATALAVGRAMVVRFVAAGAEKVPAFTTHG